MMTITANYEGTYRNLLNFIGELDHSEQLLIIESMSAAPQQGSNILTVSMKIDAFIRDEPAERRAGRQLRLWRSEGERDETGPSGVGAEPKKLAILVVLLVVAGGAYYWIEPTRHTRRRKHVAPAPAAKAPASAAPAAPASRATTATASSYGPRTGGAAAATSASGDDFRPTLKLPEGMDLSRIDPTLKLDLLAKVRRTSPSKAGRAVCSSFIRRLRRLRRRPK